MAIVIKNLRNASIKHKYQVRVDRQSPLGNKFYMSDDSQRDTVCDKYEEWLNDMIALKNGKVINELNRLYMIYKRHGKLELFCWCAPKRCHAESIKTVIENSLRKYGTSPHVK